jgi:hypothetical protein
MRPGKSPVSFLCRRDLARPLGSFSALAGDNFTMGSKRKTCSKCAQEKPLGEFYEQAGGAQGRRGACKECFKAAGGGLVG